MAISLIYICYFLTDRHRSDHYIHIMMHNIHNHRQVPFSQGYVCMITF